MKYYQISGVEGFSKPCCLSESCIHVYQIGRLEISKRSWSSLFPGHRSRIQLELSLEGARMEIQLSLVGVQSFRVQWDVEAGWKSFLRVGSGQGQREPVDIMWVPGSILFGS